MAIFISEEVDFITREKEGHFIIIKGQLIKKYDNNKCI